jgi:phospholipase/lecithinase/hemolysin
MPTQPKFYFPILMVMLFAVTGSAGTYSRVIVYGDSHSDNGNVYRQLGIPAPPYWDGRWSNGPVAVEDLAATLHLTLLDNAWGGATTGIGNIVDGGTTTRLGSDGLPGMTTTFNATKYSFSPVVLQTALFVIWGGGNDFGTDGYTTTVADHAAANLVAIAAGLQRLGAKSILVVGMRDEGLDPEYVAQGQQFAALVTYLSNYFNQKLTAELPRGVLYYDTYTWEHRVVSNPGAYGLTDVSDPCYNNGVVCGNPDQYLFWDGVHMTKHVHTILAREFSFAVCGSLCLTSSLWPAPASLQQPGSITGEPAASATTAPTAVFSSIIESRPSLAYIPH